jgi:CheY-like chemotaxis protein
MITDLKSFSESSQGFTKSPLGIIALFIVLVYGFATLAVSFGANLKEYVGMLVYFLVFFPVIVFFGFLWLVSKHPDKIYGPSDFRNEDNFLKMKLSAVASLAVATAKQPDGKNDIQLTQLQLDSIIDLVSKTSSNNKDQKKQQSEKWRNRILWVDDRPENNVYERQAFESQGIEISLALSTNEALEILNTIKYAVIISDMGRKEGTKGGYVLLEKIRKSGDKTPFFIYAGSNSPEHKKLALDKGAQGSTNRPQELYEMVLNTIYSIK